MSLLNSLRHVATKLGLIQIAVVANAAEPTRITTRAISLQQLTTELRHADVNALAAAPAEFSVPFESIFATAGITTATAQGRWSIDKIHELVTTPPYKEQSRDQVQPALLAILAAQKIPVEDLVKDAMARDKAIDAYATQVFQKRQERRRAFVHQTLELKDQIATLQAKLNLLEEESQAAARQWTDWWQRKLAYERQMAQAVGYLLQEPIISIDVQPPPDHNSE